MEGVPFTLTFLIFVCEVGRLPGFRGLAYFSLCGWVDLRDPYVFRNGIGQFSVEGRVCSLKGTWEPGTVQLRKMVSLGDEKVPAFDGRVAHFLDHEYRVHL